MDNSDVFFQHKEIRNMVDNIHIVGRGEYEIVETAIGTIFKNEKNALLVKPLDENIISEILEIAPNEFSTIRTISPEVVNDIGEELSDFLCSVYWLVISEW